MVVVSGLPALVALHPPVQQGADDASKNEDPNAFRNGARAYGHVLVKHDEHPLIDAAVGVNVSLPERGFLDGIALFVRVSHLLQRLRLLLYQTVLPHTPMRYLRSGMPNQRRTAHAAHLQGVLACSIRPGSTLEPDEGGRNTLMTRMVRLDTRAQSRSNTQKHDMNAACACAAAHLMSTTSSGRLPLNAMEIEQTVWANTVFFTPGFCTAVGDRTPTVIRALAHAGLTMDPTTLLQRPAESASKQATEKGMAMGAKLDYKSCYLDTLSHNKVEQGEPKNSAPWPATKRMVPSDKRNPLAKYDDPELGTKPSSLPYARLESTGVHAPGLFPREPHQKEEIDGAQPRLKPYLTKPAREMSSLTTRDIDGAVPDPKMGPIRAKPTSPLCPTYPVASCKPVAQPEPKFLRDSIACKDINDGNVWHRKLFVTPRESATMYCDDIRGTRSRPRVHIRNAPYQPGPGIDPIPITSDGLEGRDIYAVVDRLPFKFHRTTRRTNPVDPTGKDGYRYNVPSNDPMQGPMMGHRLSGEVAKPVPKEVSDNWTLPGPTHMRSTRFATGAKFLNYPGPRHDDRPGPAQLPGDVTYREYMLRSDDIVGAQADTKGRFQSRTTPFHRTQLGTSNWGACANEVDKSYPKGEFTLLPAHIVTRRLAESMQSGSGSQTARASFADVQNAYTTQGPENQTTYQEAFARNSVQNLAGAKAGQSLRPAEVSKLQLSKLPPKPPGEAPDGPASSRRPSPPGGGSKRMGTPRLAPTPPRGSANGTPKAAATPRVGNSGAATPRSSGPRSTGISSQGMQKLVAAFKG